MNDYKAKKKFGQNFLIDKSVLIKIIDNLDIKKDDLIIEIGPGKGALTKYLKLFKTNIICYEIDKDLDRYLDSFKDDKTKILYKDFLDADIKSDIENIKYNSLFIVANLPYYITTPIIEKIIKSGIDVKESIFMVQDEVADRLCASPGSRSYGYISVILDYYYERKKLFKVLRNSFDPIPNVDSAIIKLEKRKENIYVKDIKYFENFVKNAFLMKRKNLKNNLKKYDLKTIEKVLNDYSLSLDDRAEKVPIKAFVDIVNELIKK